MRGSEISDILDFWFSELSPQQWFKVDPLVDATIKQRFEPTYDQFAKSIPEAAYGVPHTALACVIALDQFPRNMYRGTPKAFATDGAALTLAAAVIENGLDQALNTQERMFLYMPYQHSEDAAVQRRSLKLFAQLGDANTLDFAKRHKVIIDRFGRFPHRNAILGRASTKAELTFLSEPGSSF